MIQSNIAPMNPFCFWGIAKRNPWWCSWNEAEMFFSWDCAHYGATPLSEVKNALQRTSIPEEIQRKGSLQQIGFFPLLWASGTIWYHGATTGNH